MAAWSADRVNSIVIDLKKGNDAVSFNSLANGGTQALAENITIKSSAGTDLVHLADGHDVTLSGTGHTLTVSVNDVATLDGQMLSWNNPAPSPSPHHSPPSGQLVRFPRRRCRAPHIGAQSVHRRPHRPQRHDRPVAQRRGRQHRRFDRAHRPASDRQQHDAVRHVRLRVEALQLHRVGQYGQREVSGPVARQPGRRLARLPSWKS